MTEEKKDSYRRKVKLLFWILFLLLIYIFRISILQGFGKFLIKEGDLKDTDAIVVLSGDPFDRGNEAVKIFKQGFAPEIICTGSNVTQNLKALHTDYLESTLTKINMVYNGVDSSKIFLMVEGTSTKEEGEALIKYCKKNNLKTVIVVSSKFHTRRIYYSFHKKFKENNIELILHGAPSSIYKEQEWWKSEEGLISVNNEYVKLVYYFFKY